MGDNRAIGVFDSGLGGLTVLSAIQKSLPHENLVYFGDTARVPYGSKSRDTVIHYSLEIADFLIQQNVKMIVVACNTASSHALIEMKKKVNVPVIGVVEPGVKALAKLFKHSGKAAVIATKSTVKSNSYVNAAREIQPEIHLYQKACPLLVPLIEEGFTNKTATEMIIREYLDEIIREEIKHIILGCTHYPLLKETIKRLYPNVIQVDSSVETAIEVKSMLEQKQLMNDPDANGTIKLFVSDITDSLLEMEKLFFGGTIDSMEKVMLGW
jgi:glutamate racemase